LMRRHRRIGFKKGGTRRFGQGHVDELSDRIGKCFISYIYNMLSA
jgi:hypothetical protein